MTYPKEISRYENINEDNLQIQVFGKRITESQTIGEYLLEFLLVFTGEYGDEKGLNKIINENGELKYKVSPNIGLKRFIFFENSKVDKRYEVDKEALSEHNKLINSCIKSESYKASDITKILKNMFYGFNLVTKQRGWFAQSMMPIADNLIFCESMGKLSERAGLKFNNEGVISTDVDKKFQFRAHNFMARGGEVYYLHLKQGFDVIFLSNEEKANKMKKNINIEMDRMINAFPQLKTISNLIQNKWIDYVTPSLQRSKTHNKPAKTFYEKSSEVYKEYEEVMSCKWIKAGYKEVAGDTFTEIHNLMITEINEFEKMELLNTGIILQIIRMMTTEAYRLVTNKLKPMFLLHLTSNSLQDKKIKQLAVKKYADIEKYMVVCLANHLEEYGLPKVAKTSKVKNDVYFLKKAYVDSHKLIRKLGKSIGLIIPVTGPSMRMTVSDRIVRYFVIALVNPGEMITLDTFLKKLYNNYGIVIREKEYTLNAIDCDELQIYAPYLQQNLDEFVVLLSKNGFLRELSDATAIVENSYDRVSMYEKDEE